jgi:hypothetical protein
MRNNKAQDTKMNNDDKHTPGPWRVEGWTVCGAKSGHIISHGTNTYGDGPEGYVCNTSGTSDADAALMARAPSLLARVRVLEELLSECAEFIESYSDVVDGDYGDPSPNRAMSLVSHIQDYI